MASNPTDANPIVFNQAMGINDAQSELKRPNGTVPFALNFIATGDVWDRREGRDYAFQYTGLTLSLYQFIWDDGLLNNGVQVGDALYDFTSSVWFVLGSGKKLIIQSQDLNWWDVTPTVNAEINPTVVATPATAAQTVDFVVQNNQNFGVTYATRTILFGIDRDDGIYALQTLPAQGYQSLNDLVFSYASGKYFISIDRHGNRWKLGVDNDGTPTMTT